VTAARALELFWADDKFELETARKAARLRSTLEKIAQSSPLASQIKGRGMMSGIEMQSGDIAAEICGECFKNGLIIETSGSHDEVVKVLAPLTIPDADLDAGLAILADAVRAATARRKKSAA
jgi:diaminobutyrate-2-oxoglutarate transaminase